MRQGKHVVTRPAAAHADLHATILSAETAVVRYRREMAEGFDYLRGNRYVVFLGISWALFIGAMLTQGVITAPLDTAG